MNKQGNKMNNEMILKEIFENGKTLVFVSKEFCGKPLVGAYVKDTNGDIIKVHGKSAKAARKAMLADTNHVILRSYAKGHITLGVKTTPVFVNEFRKLVD